MSKATICIITCRRPEGLKRLLETLILQDVSSETELGIIVVDNACEQRTADVVTEIQTKTQYPVHYYEESEPGIVAARNKCIEQFLVTDSELLLFIDDDEWPESNSWAQKMIDAQIKYKADIIASNVISIGEEGTPQWAIELLYGNNKLTEGEKITTFYTGNVLITKPVLETIKPAFDARFAMTGGSDYHFALKCNRKGYNVIYTNALAIEEFPKSRATIKWFIKRGFRSGVSYTRSFIYEDGYLKALPRCLLMAGTRFVRGLYYFILGVITLNKLKFVDGLFRFSSFVGSIAGFFGMEYKEYETIHGQ